VQPAVKLDVSACIEDGYLTSRQVSDRLSAVRKGGQRLLDALVAMELLAKVDDNISTHPPVKNFFPKTPPNISATSLCMTTI
jgi:hypothetical protein